MYTLSTDTSEAVQHVSRPLAVSMDDAVTLIEKITRSVAVLEAVQWAITLKERDELIGIIGFWRMAKEHCSAELGYILAQEQWGRGLISEAIAAVLGFGFEQLGLHKVEAIARPINKPLSGRWRERLCPGGSTAGRHPMQRRVRGFPLFREA